MNLAILTGRLVKDIELRYTSNNKACCNFTLAVNRAFQKDKTDFINCLAWEKQAENLNKYCSKGSLVNIEGSIETRNYEDKTGKKVYITEVRANKIEFLSKAKEKVANTNTQEDVFGLDDELPF